ncbi:hypothetical protein [Klebsiella grimontii]|uniref:hypothetical protein n=1 Tax=Klebsiella grimontii TaxID=2058152 RepID=UPI001CCF7984|nr:hypothetical protein [Klebsiella grimontii]MBZ7674748.1 hypothetical protein [Klebsiella grimontii]
MELKNYNRIILAFTLVLFLLCMFVIFYAIKFNGVKIELGSISDWVSSLSTFGTLIVAYLAYKKAPEWINQKMHEDAFSVAKKVILEDYPLLKEKIDNAGHAVDLYVIYFDSIGDDCEVSITADECDEALSVFHDVQNTPAKIKRKLEKIAKLGWSIDRNVLIINENLSECYREMQKNYVVAFIGIQRMLLAQTLNGKRRSVNKVAINFETFQKNKKKFDLLYNEIMLRHQRVTDYFEVKKD